MATAHIGYRRCAVGISAGLGLALPLVAYVAAQPLDGTGEAIRAGAMPFAAGVVAGVGLLTITGHVLDARAERIAAEKAEAASLTSVFSRVEAGHTVATGAAQADAVRGAGTSAKPADAAPRGRRFGRKRELDGVPVITRAIGALDEIEAWAEIDSMLSDGSPFSCDPARSKDVYQIALEELMNTARASAKAETPAPAAAAEPTAEEREAAADREAAMASLYGEGASERSCVPVLPTISAVEARPTSKAVAAPTAVEAPAMAAEPETSASAADVPVADYSGHEAMWARALAILDEDMDEPVPAGLSGATAALGAATAPRANRPVHHTSHEYLRVIEGGTASMPSLEVAEA
ncbi:MAG: hypothetical protein Q4B77_07735 [Coriobacteriaceae bacterium]|nr:hypothetical protein [Coriobacteriaceae bacterium]